MRLYTLGVLALLACRTDPEPIRPATPAGTARPLVADPPTWRAGVGLDGCALGDALPHCEARFGTGQRKDEYALFPAHGFQLGVVDGRVRAVFVKYQGKGLTPFAGADDKGIGATSTIADVEAAYGPPKDVSDSVVSEYGEYPGARDHTLIYEGLVFTFLDDRLGHVAILAR